MSFVTKITALFESTEGDDDITGVYQRHFLLNDDVIDGSQDFSFPAVDPGFLVFIKHLKDRGIIHA